jgi:hypothetical protein
LRSFTGRLTGIKKTKGSRRFLVRDNKSSHAHHSVSLFVLWEAVHPGARFDRQQAVVGGVHLRPMY